MRHVALGHMYIQELVQIKQVIIGKIDGKQNPANTLTKHLATASDMLGSLDGLGVIDLTDKGFQEHVRKTKLRVVSSVNFKKWKPLMALKTTWALSAPILGDPNVYSTVSRNQMIQMMLGDF